MNELTEEEKKAYEEQLENTTVKSLLIEQNAILRALYDELTQGKDTTESEQWKCGYCNEVVTDREQHLVESHNSPPDPNPNQDGEFYKV